MHIACWVILVVLECCIWGMECANDSGAILSHPVDPSSFVSIGSGANFTFNSFTMNTGLQQQQSFTMHLSNFTFNTSSDFWIYFTIKIVAASGDYFDSNCIGDGMSFSLHSMGDFYSGASGSGLACCPNRPHISFLFNFLLKCLDSPPQNFIMVQINNNKLANCTPPPFFDFNTSFINTPIPVSLAYYKRAVYLSFLYDRYWWITDWTVDLPALFGSTLPIISWGISAGGSKFSMTYSDIYITSKPLTSYPVTAAGPQFNDSFVPIPTPGGSQVNDSFMPIPTPVGGQVNDSFMPVPTPAGPASGYSSYLIGSTLFYCSKSLNCGCLNCTSQVPQVIINQNQAWSSGIFITTTTTVLNNLTITNSSLYAESLWIKNGGNLVLSDSQLIISSNLTFSESSTITLNANNPQPITVKQCIIFNGTLVLSLNNTNPKLPLMTSNCTTGYYQKIQIIGPQNCYTSKENYTSGFTITINQCTEEEKDVRMYYYVGGGIMGAILVVSLGVAFVIVFQREKRLAKSLDNIVVDNEILTHTP